MPLPPRTAPRTHRRFDSRGAEPPFGNRADPPQLPNRKFREKLHLLARIHHPYAGGFGHPGSDFRHLFSRSGTDRTRQSGLFENVFAKLPRKRFDLRGRSADELRRFAERLVERKFFDHRHSPARVEHPTAQLPVQRAARRSTTAAAPTSRRAWCIGIADRAPNTRAS